MREARFGVALMLAVACIFAAGPAEAAESDVDFNIGLNLGYDSNPHQLATNEPGGAFAELDLGFDVDVELGRSFDYFFEIDGTAYQSDVDNANTLGSGLATGFAFTPYRQDGRRFTIAVGGILGMRRSTFVSHTTGEILEVMVDPLTSVPIPDRFDSDTVGGFLDLELRLNRKVMLTLDTLVENRNYVEDYETLPGVDTLDYQRVTIEPGVRFNINGAMEIRVSLPITDREYDERPARDIDGIEVPGTIREYQYQALSVWFDIDAGGKWDFSIGLRGTDREDTFENYYDSMRLNASVRARREIGDNARLSLYGSLQDIDYDNATVLNEVAGEIRSSDRTRFRGRYERVLSSRIDLYVEAGTESEGNEDPVFAYDRTWTAVGLKFQM